MAQDDEKIPVDPGEAGPSPSLDLPRESTRAILFQFVLIPLGVVAVGVLIFVLFGMLASERHTTREYLRDIRSGSSHRRWQAAYELSKAVKRGEGNDDQALAKEIRELYAASADDDPRIRQYLGMVLGRLGDKAATPLLTASLAQADAENQIYALLALAELADPASVPAIAPLAKSEDAGLRKAALYALGRIGGVVATETLAAALSDPVTDVRWNAAIALARARDPRGAGVLREMIDRTRLDQVPGIREDQKEEAMMAGISALVELGNPDVKPDLERIAASDPNLRVRSAAMEAVGKLGN